MSTSGKQFLETLHLLWNKKCSFHPLNNIALTFTDLSCSMWGFLFEKIPFHFFCCNLIFFFERTHFAMGQLLASFFWSIKVQSSDTHARTKNVFAGSSFLEKQKEIVVQAALVIRGLFICGFAYSRSKSSLFWRTNPSILAYYWSFYSRFCNSRSKFLRTYLPRITRETCILIDRKIQRDKEREWKKRKSKRMWEIDINRDIKR